MEFFPSVFDKVIDITADIIVAIAIHVPILMHALMLLPMTPVATTTPQTAAVTPPAATSTIIKIYPPKIAPLASSTKIRVLITEDFTFAGTNEAPGKPPKIGKIKVEVVPKEEESGTAIFGDAYLYGKEIAKGVPVDSTLEGVSPDESYYAYRSLSHASAISSNTSIEIFNLQTGEHSRISTPPGEVVSNHVTDNHAVSWYEVLPYIESYAWEDDHSVNFIFYYLAWTSHERVSPREVWNYNIITKSYRLVPTGN